MIDYDIEERCYTFFHATAGWGVDIGKHIPTLRKYAAECDHVTEMGVRSAVSTWAFLAAKPDKLVSYDICLPKEFESSVEIEDIVRVANKNGIEFVFIQDNVLNVIIEETDMLFIDTLHNYEQLKLELEYHSDKVKKYIILHDTTTYALVGETSELGISKAITEFLEKNSWWKIKEVFENCNGLTILERIQI